MVILQLLLLALLFYWMTVLTGRWFIASLDNISDALKIPPNIAGATFMAVGTSAPEMFTTIIALLILPTEGVDVGVGNVVGSAIFQILVVIGFAALARRAHINWRPVARDSLIYAGAVILLLWVLWDGQISFHDASLMLAYYGVYLMVLFAWQHWLDGEEYNDIDPLEELENQFEPAKTKRLPWWRHWHYRARLERYIRHARRWLDLPLQWIPDPDKDKRWTLPVFLLSLAGISALTYLIVESAVWLAHTLHIPSRVVALTILAGGSSLPEMVSSYIVAKQGRTDMAISNALGSNTYAVLVAIGVPYLVMTWWQGPLIIASENVISSGFLLFVTLIGVIGLIGLRRWNVNARLGSFLIFLYLCYVVAAYGGWL